MYKYKASQRWTISSFISADVFSLCIYIQNYDEIIIAIDTQYLHTKRERAMNYKFSFTGVYGIYCIGYGSTTEIFRERLRLFSMSFWRWDQFQKQKHSRNTYQHVRLTYLIDLSLDKTAWKWRSEREMLPFNLLTYGFLSSCLTLVGSK